MPVRIRSVILPLSVSATVIAAAVAGWQLGAPPAPKLADALPEAAVEAPSMVEGEVETVALSAPLAPPEPLPVLRLEDLPLVPHGPVAERDLPPAQVPSRQFATLSLDWAEQAAEVDDVIAEAERAVRGADPAAEPEDIAAEPEPQPEPEPAVVAVEPEPEPEPAVVAAAPVAEPQPVSVAVGPVLHVASYYGPKTAATGWRVLSGQAKGLLADAAPETRAVQIDGQRYVRLFARLPAGVDAGERCGALRRAGLYCAAVAEASSQLARSDKAR